MMKKCWFCNKWFEADDRSTHEHKIFDKDICPECREKVINVVERMLIEEGGLEK